MEKDRLAAFHNYFSTKEFEEAYYYDGNDLGAVWSKEETRFRVWAPTATQVMLQLYRTGDQEDLLQSIPMNKSDRGTWHVVITGDFSGTYYTYLVTVENDTKEAVDPYARAVGANGKRGMVVDLAATNPQGFTEEVKPVLDQPTDAIIYEIHVRDFSADDQSGMLQKGKFLAFTETGTTNSFSNKTGLEHLKELGITHIHMMPAFDYMTVDETQPDLGQYNWGYDPLNYNVPEGSYSTDPYHGEIRIREMKRMIQALHQNGIRVIMDVVYNHTMENVESNFNRIVPGYYYRLTPEGYFSNASGCGNETASERPMMRKFIIDSVVYWAKEYHIDGFRFDLMGVHDIKTMNDIRDALDQVDSSILLYGEGWTGGLSTLPEWERAVKVNMGRLNCRIAAFSDSLRDGIKGSVFQSSERGFISGKEGMEETIKAGVAASIWHESVDYQRVIYTNMPWATEPTQTIGYTSAHDNLTLWDKLTLSTPGESRENRVKMNLLSAAILFTCQGIPFFQAGEEFLRSKPLDESGTVFEENSYKSPDFINSLKWDDKSKNNEVFNYYQGLIAFRKANPALHLTKSDEIRNHLTFLNNLEPNLVGFLLKQESETLCIIYNANPTPKTVPIPEAQWIVYAKEKQGGTRPLESFYGSSICVAPISAVILKTKY